MSSCKVSIWVTPNAFRNEKTLIKNDFFRTPVQAQGAYAYTRFIYMDGSYYKPWYKFNLTDR